MDTSTDELTKHYVEGKKENVIVELGNTFINGVVIGAIESIDTIPHVKAITTILGLAGVAVEVNKNNQTMDTIKGNIDLGNVLEVFSVSAALSQDDDGKLVFHQIEIDYTELATKIYTFREQGHSASNEKEFFETYTTNKKDLGDKSTALYDDIYLKDESKHSKEHLQQLQNKKVVIEKIAEELKNGTK